MAVYFSDNWAWFSELPLPAVIVVRDLQAGEMRAYAEVARGAHGEQTPWENAGLRLRHLTRPPLVAHGDTIVMAVSPPDGIKVIEIAR